MTSVADANALPFRTDDEIARALPRILQHLAGHGVIAYPTETVYGFGTRIDAPALERLVSLKPREASKPFLVLIADRSMLNTLGVAMPDDAERLAARFWPGPLTLVLPSIPGHVAEVPLALRGETGGIAVRWTSHAAAQRLVTANGAPITSTSANRPSLPPARSAEEIVKQWEADVKHGSLLVLDGGPSTGSLASTVVDCCESHPRIVRRGAIDMDAIRSVVPDVVGDT